MSYYLATVGNPKKKKTSKVRIQTEIVQKEGGSYEKGKSG